MEPQIFKIGTPAKSMDTNSVAKVRVIVRVRPFLPQEIAANNGNPKSCISVLDQSFGASDEVVVHLSDPQTSRNECYQVDSFFDQEDDNVSQIFSREVNPLIPGIFHGCNATVFAYGATGSGKTYTMQGTNELPGLMPLVMSTVLSMCKKTGSTVDISYYEVYMDRCYDLLEVKAQEIVIRDDKDGQIHLRGLSHVPVHSMSKFNEVFSCGVQRRKVAHTGLNDASSRSHGVLVISVSSHDGDASGAVITGKMNLIDLAGNEDNRRTHNEGIRLQESSKINQSLFALSNVIYALNNNKPRVPYRESKLTRILQDSLGGTSRALMVACLNPGEYHESVHTVSLAARSRHISNYIPSNQKVETPMVELDMEVKLQAWLESKGKTKSLQRLRACGSPFLGKTPCSLSSVKKTNYHNPENVKAAKAKKGTTTCVPFSNLFNDEVTMDSRLEGLHLAADTKDHRLELDTYLPGKSVDIEREELGDSADLAGSQSERKKALESPQRKALSPVNSNVNPQPLDQLSSPKTPFTASWGKKNSQTSVDNFCTWSNSLKSCVIQEYIHFLNTASREELVGLKGIGWKMAEYICEVRETSPIKKLKDLEEIGLSWKQVHNMFSKAARGIFETAAEEAEPRI